jgi:putative hemolysin
MSKTANHKANFLKMADALENEEAVIVFPAGEVSRARPTGIMDSRWKTGFLRLAKRTHSPILPMQIKARNSLGFYAASTIYKPFGSMLLMHEMFTKHNQSIKIKVGKLIPWDSIKQSELTLPAAALAIKTHTYKLLKYKNDSVKCPFETIETIAIPACRQSIRDDLKQAQHIMTTPTGLDLYMVDYKADSAIIHELGRVRELTFRKVGEGTGSNWDLDQYDRFYRHLILWDDKNLEMVGGYRLGECGKLIEKHGMDALYMNHMYHIKPEMQKYLPNALELGRCFVQPQYWGTRALDYLWLGMGSYIASHPEIKYLVGSISLSNAYSTRARELIVSFYNTQLGFSEDVANAKCPFIISDEIKQLALKEFTGDYQTCFKRLNELLNEQDETLPMLFKQYVDLCEDKGTQFIDFSLAPDFNNCIGSLIIIDLDKIKAAKHNRYLKKLKECA